MRKTYYQGQIIAKKEGMGVLGEFIVLHVDCGEGVKILETASWVLERFNLGDTVEWYEALFHDPTSKIEKIEAFEVKDEQLEKLLHKLPDLAQRQYDTDNQLNYALRFATKLGLYDAVDLIKKITK